MLIGQEFEFTEIFKIIKTIPDWCHRSADCVPIASPKKERVPINIVPPSDTDVLYDNSALVVWL